MTNKNQVKLENVQGSKILNSLIDFGFSENESKIYLYLLELGRETGGSKIAVATKMHRQYVYSSLPKLINLGLIVEVEHGLQSKYKAVSPSQIEKIAKKKVVEAEDLSVQLKRISKVGHEQDFEVLVGEQAILDFEMSFVYDLKQGEEDYVIGGHSAGFSELMGSSLEEYLSIKNNKNCKVFYIGHSSERESYSKYGDQQNLETKFLDNLPTGVTHMVIRRDKVLFFSFLNPPLLYVIKSEVVAKNYKDFFMMLWNMAK